jgi:putative phosphonate metabolism protein
MARLGSGEMIDGFARYAIYWAPEAGGPLARFGAEWLGWDAEAGVARAQPDLPGLPAPAAQITATPRRYGFHATMKPPFALAPGMGAGDLLGALRALAGGMAAFDAPALAFSAANGFASLRLGAPSPALAALAAAAVRDLDRFRAPPSAQDLARRRAAPLPAGAEANLARWGYPWVMDLFHFHLTLSGPLAAPALSALEAALSPALAPFLAAPLPINALCLFGDPGNGAPFRLLARAPLGQG